MCSVSLCVRACTDSGLKHGEWEILVLYFHRRKPLDVGLKKREHCKHIIYRYEDKCLEKELKESHESMGLPLPLIGFIDPFHCWNYVKNKNWIKEKE